MRVTVEIVPHGLEKEKYLLRTYEIGNLGHLDHMNPSICRYAAWEVADGEPRTGRRDGVPYTRAPDGYVWHDRNDGPSVLVERVLARLRTGRESTEGLPHVYPGTRRQRVPSRARQLAEAASE